MNRTAVRKEVNMECACIHCNKVFAGRNSLSIRCRHQKTCYARRVRVRPPVIVAESSSTPNPPDSAASGSTPGPGGFTPVNQGSVSPRRLWTFLICRNWISVEMTWKIFCLTFYLRCRPERKRLTSFGRLIPHVSPRSCLRRVCSSCILTGLETSYWEFSMDVDSVVLARPLRGGTNWTLSGLTEKDTLCL